MLERRRTVIEYLSSNVIQVTNMFFQTTIELKDKENSICVNLISTKKVLDGEDLPFIALFNWDDDLKSYTYCVAFKKNKDDYVTLGNPFFSFKENQNEEFNVTIWNEP